MAFLKAGEVSLFKNKYYKVSVSIGSNLLGLRPTFCIIDTRAGPSLLRADILDQSWLNTIRQRSVSEIRVAQDIKLSLSATIIPHHFMGESRTRVAFDVVDKAAVPVLLVTTDMDTFLK